MAEDTKIGFGDIADKYTDNKTVETGNKTVENVERTYDEFRETTDNEFDRLDDFGFGTGGDDVWGI